VKPAGSDSLLALQFADKRVFYYGALALWLAGLYVWARVDRSMARSAMEAIGEDETAAASVGIHVTRFKVGITVLSAVLTAIGGIAYAQYISYVNPDTLAGIGVSLRIVFAVVLGGMYSMLGPTVGTALTIALAEYLRVLFGLRFIGMAETIYGLLLILFIIFLPAGIYGSVRQLVRRRRPAPAGA
jgi:branched-chain amino acid transport system permease protein